MGPLHEHVSAHDSTNLCPGSVAKDVAPVIIRGKNVVQEYEMFTFIAVEIFHFLWE